MAEGVPGWPIASDPLSYLPLTSLLAGHAAKGCRAVVIVPARNEEASLPAMLDALAAQRDLNGDTLDPHLFEVLLLLNNCTDHSDVVAHTWQRVHTSVSLHVIERTLPPARAHVGTARRWLMDTAWTRLRDFTEACAILSTDSDTMVAPDWIARNLDAIACGADAVGGIIEIEPRELARLPEGARTSYLADREYQRCCAQLEDLLDPQAGDPWPRHLEHFGASLACTPAAYALAGGLPPVNPLEDMAFVEALRRTDARLRHDPAVRVFTSARFDGRAAVGLSWQLRTWQHMYETGEQHRVPNAAWLEHRFRSLRKLRELHRSGCAADLSDFDSRWRGRLRRALAQEDATGAFLARIDCEDWLNETYTGPSREAEISQVNSDLRESIRRARLTVADGVPEMLLHNA